MDLVGHPEDRFSHDAAQVWWGRQDAYLADYYAHLSNKIMWWVLTTFDKILMITHKVGFHRSEKYLSFLLSYMHIMFMKYLFMNLLSFAFIWKR